ncbi:sperm receptor for egg jelly-like [Haliotis rubra]|uniref:sperm receptor for egg jelly-like n=1 Tax=Haliotis rubra TaxID=36100 RepID=UPI001EE51EC0|nr:sperm receptor for egg jelly-like [Haliotis rubra]
MSGTMTRTRILLQVACAAVLFSHGLSSSTTLRKRQRFPTSRSDLRCLQCDHVSDPADCEVYSICGHGEICFTREIIDHHDKQAYRMGCESSQICSLYKNAETIFGRRRYVLSEEEARLCFDCCSTDDCNSALCPFTASGTTTFKQADTTTTKSIQTTVAGKTAATTTEATTTTGSGCPSGFVNWKMSCYFFNLTNAYWADGRNYCRSNGADLASINTPEEDTFITQQLESLQVPAEVRGMWLGGTYDDVNNKFKWLDGSDVMYGRFKPGAPRKQMGECLLLINPTVNAIFAGWPWASDRGSALKRGFICETKQIGL